MLLMSWSGISVPGAGYDTYRYWEIPATGACLVSFRTPITIPEDFTHWKNAIFVDDLYDLSKIMNFLLTERKSVQDIGYEGFLHLRSRHTSVQRAETVLRVFEEL